MPGSVAIVRALHYADAVSAVQRIMERAGCLDRLAGPPARILVKPNLIHAASPADAATTHPEVVRGVVVALQRLGHHPLIADSYSGAFPWSRRGLERVYAATGMADVARATGCDLSFDLSWNVRSLAAAATVARIEVLHVVEDVTHIVNVPKLKTHSYTGITCAVKNLFGVVPGHYKVSYHARFAEAHRFCAALEDLALALPVAATVVDGIVAMEGEGPAAGDPRSVGAIMAGLDLLAIDRVAERFCGFLPGRLPSPERGPVEVDGPLPEDLVPGGLRKATPHQLDMGVFRSPLIRAVARRALREVFSPAPVVDSARCIGCQACVASCPVEAMRPREPAPQVDRRRCIRCYCCHEACRSRAIRIPRSWLGRLLA